MTRSTKLEFLTIVLILALTNLGVYLPVFNMSSCTCRSRRELAAGSHSNVQDKGDSRSDNTFKIFNPACGAGTSFSALQARDSFVVNAHPDTKQYLPGSYFVAVVPHQPEQVYLTLPKKPPKSNSSLV